MMPSTDHSSLAPSSLTIREPGTIQLVKFSCPASHFGSITFVQGITIVSYTLVFIAVFITLQLIISTPSRRVGTSVLGSMGLWLFFVAFWSLLPAAAAELQGIPADPNNDLWLNMLTRFSLTNPGVLYQVSIDITLLGWNNPVFAGFRILLVIDFNHDLF